MKEQYRILIIDDDRTVCSSLELLLRKRGYAARSIQQPNIALDTIAEWQPDLALLDMNFTIDTSGRQGLKLLQRIREHHPSLEVILMTGWATVQLAVEGMKLGARDFLAKPWDNKHLVNSIETILTLRQPKAEPTTTTPHSHIIGSSPAIQEVLDMVARVGPTHASVLITGESGTGKELIAEAIHLQSKRADEAFVKVNLGGIPTELFESEMFGHLRGAFTGAHSDREGRFATAHRGSIFLDEIGEVNLANQVKMLRVLQERSYEKLGSSEVHHTDVRVISATNRNLEQMVNDGYFREDLYYRINLINIHLPPLRDRREDIRPLLRYFVDNVTTLYDADPPYLDEECLHWLEQQNYPGNIRQLKNFVERTILLHLGKKTLTWKDFQKSYMSQSKSGTPASKSLNLEEQEIALIQRALAQHNQSISAAARALGITRSSLYRRLEKYGIPHEPKI